MSRLVMFDYDSKWPLMYEEEKARLLPIWREQAMAIYHVGSTSVPNLKAKPIVDIMIVIKDDSRIPVYDKGMTNLGYRCRGECIEQGGTPGRFYYSKDIDGLRTYQVHVSQEGHFEIAQKLDFRDYLRSHSKVAAAYGELKAKLMNENTKGIFEYMEGKDSFVKDCIVKAQKWRTTEQAHLSDPSATRPGT